MDYKKIVPSQELRFKILNLLRFIPDRIMIDLQYRIKLGRKPDLKNPKRYSEKLQWYKLYYRDPLMTQCSDKYLVRDYIKSKSLENILNRLYAVYNNVDGIELNELPEKFIMKTTNGSGTNFFCKDKKEFDFQQAKQSLNKWLNRDIYASGRERSYKKIKPKIIVEALLEDPENPYGGINDYKFLCFGGKPKYIVLDVDRHCNHKRNIYDTNWNFIDVSTDHPNFGDCYPKPERLDNMLNIAKKLSEDFPAVRVDLYLVKGEIYFGELTFYPWTGYVQFEPDDFDYELGEQFILPGKTD